MIKKGIALLTLVAFSFWSFSCSSIKSTKLKSLPEENRSGLEILSLIKTSGEVVEFQTSDPGKFRYFTKFDATSPDKLQKKVITGSVVKNKRIIFKTDTEEIIRENGKIVTVVTKDGDKISSPPFEEVEEKRDLVTFVDYEQIIIPLAEVDYVTIRRNATVTTIVLAAGALVLIGVTVSAVSANTSE